MVDFIEMSHWMTLSIAALLIFTTECGSLHKQYEGHKLFRIYTKNIDHLQILNRIEEFINGSADYWRLANRIGDAADLRVHPLIEDQVLNLLQQNNLPYRLIIKNLQSDFDRELHERSGRNIFKCGDDAASIDINSYHSFDEIECYLASVKSKYPIPTKIINIGKSYERRNLIAIKINDGNSKAIAAFLVGGMHAREWISIATMIYIIRELTENATEYWHLLDKMDIYIMPVLNPDGYIYSWATDRMWRKTRSDSSHNGCYGVDLNRNWNFEWQVFGASSTSCANVYAGPFPFSEPESRQLADFLHLNNETIRAFFDVHAYGELFLYPYGYTFDAPRNIDVLNKTAILATQLMNNVNGAQFRYGSIANMLYPASGSAIDYVKGVLNTEYTYAIELRPGDESTTGFLLPASQIHLGASEAWIGIQTVLNKVAYDDDSNA